LAEQLLLDRRGCDAGRRIGEQRRLDRFGGGVVWCLFRLLGEDALEHALAALGEPIEPDAHAGRDRRPARIVLAGPHHGALAADERRGVAELELEPHLGPDGERLLRTNEDAALADIYRVALDELLQRLTLELDLE